MGCALEWSVPLGHPPAVLRLGQGHHGQVPVERYRLPGLWCLHLYSYSATVRVNDVPLEIRPGFASVTAPGATLEYHFQRPSTHLYAHFRLRASGVRAMVPAMQDLGDRFAATARPVQMTVGGSTRDPARLSAVVWSLLWQLSDGVAQADLDRRGVEHAAVAAARSWIEQHLAERIDIAALARRVGVSHNHLTRLFRAQVGMPVVEFIRRRRLELSMHLLTHTTLPIKGIALQVGMHDLQQFNKYVRRGLGRAPSRLRADREME